ncbi:hypothetical protein [Carboxylicivirga marina]|uniref:HTH luxR-type domain-containing protein n=1 Tax=Carboxylicivirga marina TaxID=2800988 RepID=A0ABS1HM50_9BACT|nr:hypothetical protein [Carboxylicivirga marina]MBK3518738.1 hypothetical protein [Carboxylicivirga marina]
MKYLNTQISNVIEDEAIVIAELNGQILSGNQQALDLYNYSSIQSFKKHHLRDLMPEDFANLYPDEMTPEHVNFDGYYTHVCRKSNGELFACKLHTHYQSINGRKLLVGHVQKINGEVDIEKIRLKQNIIVLERELKAERNKNQNKALLSSSQQLCQCFPVLSSHDLKICHYIAKQYNSKQISELLNITTDGVYAARKRIRKKLQLKAGDDLTKTLINCIKHC